MNADDKVEVRRFWGGEGASLVDIYTRNSIGSTAASLKTEDAREVAKQILALCDEIDMEEVMRT